MKWSQLLQNQGNLNFPALFQNCDSQNVQKVWEIQVENQQISKSAGKFKIPQSCSEYHHFLDYLYFSLRLFKVTFKHQKTVDFPESHDRLFFYCRYSCRPKGCLSDSCSYFHGSSSAAFFFGCQRERSSSGRSSCEIELAPNHFSLLSFSY